MLIIIPLVQIHYPFDYIMSNDWLSMISHYRYRLSFLSVIKSCMGVSIVMGVPQELDGLELFTTENPIEMDDLGVPYLRKVPYQ